jgi:NAD(P)-dependent dehydrogenase (short-subunit alcohol dehydrogenase family)
MLEPWKRKQKREQKQKETNDYGNSKLFLQMWVAEVQGRLRSHPEYSHITINGLHPGFVESGIWEGLRSIGKMPGGVGGLVRWFSVTVRQGGLAVAIVATGVDGKEGGEKYFNRVWEARAKFWCEDFEARGRLWEKVDEVLGLREKGLLGGLGS